MTFGGELVPFSFPFCKTFQILLWRLLQENVGGAEKDAFTRPNKQPEGLQFTCKGAACNLDFYFRTAWFLFFFPSNFIVSIFLSLPHPVVLPCRPEVSHGGWEASVGAPPRRWVPAGHDR